MDSAQLNTLRYLRNNPDLNPELLRKLERIAASEGSQQPRAVQPARKATSHARPTPVRRPAHRSTARHTPKISGSAVAVLVVLCTLALFVAFVAQSGILAGGIDFPTIALPSGNGGSETQQADPDCPTGEASFDPFFAETLSKKVINADLLPQVGDKEVRVCFHRDLAKQFFAIVGPYDEESAFAGETVTGLDYLARHYAYQIAQPERFSELSQKLQNPESAYYDEAKTQPVAELAWFRIPPRIKSRVTVTVPPPPATNTAIPSATANPADAEKNKVYEQIKSALGEEAARKAQAAGDTEAMFVFTVTFNDITSLSGDAKVFPTLTQGLKLEQTGSGLWYAVSERKAQDGRSLFKTGTLYDFATAVPGTNGGMLVCPCEIHFSQRLPGLNPNTWGSDSRGYEVVWNAVYAYPVQLPQPTQPPTAIPQPTQAQPTMVPVQPTKKVGMTLYDLVDFMKESQVWTMAGVLYNQVTFDGGGKQFGPVEIDQFYLNFPYQVGDPIIVSNMNMDTINPGWWNCRELDQKVVFIAEWLRVDIVPSGLFFCQSHP